MKPILFNTKMVQAILEGRKTVTRRKIKLDLGLADTDKNDSSYLMIPDTEGDYYNAEHYCRYQKGDILYVRETFNDEETDTVLYAADKDFIDRGCKTVDGHLFMESEIKWKPSIHMPKKLARIFLKVTDVRVERVQDITVGDIEKEGYPHEIDFSNMPIAMQGLIFEWWTDTWNSTIEKQDLGRYGLNANPWVYVIEFEVLEMMK